LDKRTGWLQLNANEAGNQQLTPKRTVEGLGLDKRLAVAESGLGTMKLLHIICFWLSLLFALLIFVQLPFIKLGTRSAMQAIETHCLRQDLTNQETASHHWQFAKRAILANDNQYRARLDSARYLGLGVCLVLLVQSVIELRHGNKRIGAEPGASPLNGGPGRLGGNSEVREGPPSVS